MASPVLRVQKATTGTAAADAAEIVVGIDRSAKGIVLGKLCGEREYIVFPPLQAGAEKRPHLIRLGAGVCKGGVQRMVLQGDRIQVQRLIAGIAVRRREQCQGWENRRRLRRLEFRRARKRGCVL